MKNAFEYEEELTKLVQLLRDIEEQMDSLDDYPSLGYDIECRMAAVLRPVKGRASNERA